MRIDTFRNEPFTDFSEAPLRKRMEDALHDLDQRIRQGSLQSFPLLEDSRTASTHPREKVEVYDPSSSTTKIGVIEYSNLLDVEHALTSVTKGSPSWRSLPGNERSKILHRAADRMSEERFFLNALIIREVGKPWREADADVAEAIDFCRYYADQWDLLAHPRPTSQIPGEENFYFYQPKGVAVVIAPWNFPLAILCGMTVAALVTGNTVVMKPAEQSSLIGYELARILRESGIPSNALAFLPGNGELIGPKLVSDHRVQMICFTGSKSVGLQILSEAARISPNQRHIKKVVAELGGKNAIIVDSDADFDEAIKGVLTSAFGYAGQKCSACSRLIIVGSAYEIFMERLREATNDILIGEAKEPSSFLGPVIDSEAQKRILALIEQAKNSSTGKLLVEHQKTPINGFFVPPTIFFDVSPSDPLWKEEIFGPVLTVTKARDFEEALELATDSQYALTGAVFSRNPAHLELARREFRVGNLYLNRGSTGALVGRQPFGGFGMSGIGSKAGGPDYLLQFVDPRSVTENTTRRGFAPE